VAFIGVGFFCCVFWSARVGSCWVALTEAHLSRSVYTLAVFNLSQLGYFLFTTSDSVHVHSSAQNTAHITAYIGQGVGPMVCSLGLDDTLEGLVYTLDFVCFVLHRSGLALCPEWILEFNKKSHII
jgi:hypothetical protein